MKNMLLFGPRQLSSSLIMWELLAVYIVCSVILVLHNVQRTLHFRVVNSRLHCLSILFLSVRSLCCFYMFTHPVLGPGFIWIRFSLRMSECIAKESCSLEFDTGKNKIRVKYCVIFLYKSFIFTMIL